MPQEEAINLLKKVPLEKQAPKRKVFLWFSTFGKTIIIGVNVITIGAFLYRVKIDQERMDLKEKVGARERVLVANKAFEEEFRFFQNKVNLLKDFSSDSAILSQLDLIESSMPSTVVSQTISLDGEKVVIDAESQDNTALSFLVSYSLDKGAREFVLKEARLDRDNYSVKFELLF